MAGHSKWANIKFRKAAQDNRRGKLFSKLIREITVAAKSGGDPDGNPRLRSAVDKALSANMTREVINRAIQRGTGASGGDDYQDVIYEGYGPGGVAMLIECSTDNRNRTVGEVRHALSKHGGNLGTEGSVAYLFSRVGVIRLPPGCDEEQVMDVVATAGADDMELSEDGSIEITAAPEQFASVVQAVEEAGLTCDDAGLEHRATSDMDVDGDSAERIMNLISALDEVDDVQDIYTNARFAE